MKDEFKMYRGRIKPFKSTGTHWIDHQIHDMQHLVDKYELYSQHLQHKAPEKKKTKDHAILQGKFNKSMNAKLLLWSCFFIDALFAAKQLSSTTQKADIDIISITDNVESTKNSYEKLPRKFESDEDSFIIANTQIRDQENWKPQKWGTSLPRAKVEIL